MSILECIMCVDLIAEIALIVLSIVSLRREMKNDKDEER